MKFVNEVLTRAHQQLRAGTLSPAEFVALVSRAKRDFVEAVKRIRGLYLTEGMYDKLVYRGEFDRFLQRFWIIQRA